MSTQQDLKPFSTQVMAAAALNLPAHTGMLVSVTGALNNAARAQRALAVAPDTTDSDVLLEHE